ncbi:hypothetical protein [Rhizobium rhizogenes]|uniref:hypothetical protein n=1 Tax=Rhizobium rhizogenes TaxID=359 RepID=UPI0015718C98|nr:hypothetical protein [Rhizobium rhizogenes]NTF69356.1 hypothetical protein [Rhizobium rhizogenes]
MIRTLIQDVLLAMLLGVAAVIMFILPSVHPAAQEDDPISQPGNLIVSAAWPAGNDDVDLWVSYADDFAVGYSNKSGKVWSLLRDDRGMVDDFSGLNFESAFTRGLPDGEYAINVRCYSCSLMPMPVSVEVRLADGSTIWKGTIDILKDGQERTAIRFRIANGAVVADSANQVFKQMKRMG